MEQTPDTFEGKVIEVRRFIAKLSTSFCEQQAIAFAALHHFELKQRLAEMDRHQPKVSMSMVEGFMIADGESIIRNYSVNFAAQVPEDKAPGEKEWVAKEDAGKITVKHAKKKLAKKSS